MKSHGNECETLLGCHIKFTMESTVNKMPYLLFPIYLFLFYVAVTVVNNTNASIHSFIA